ncbi:AraC family transcriptional regulator [Pseudovibrio sp. SPO723]|uniref:AraC family transcriptional regulator n=1 Tax=Nesiotobacter zosterae TaxID=392721 RepID=UPI0029C35BB1|nr:AraC family transcriptional regulator [Pseudovibrio sp. SPO723]MDX5593446.1 AraC family transcriptional regulator [Pseudovibrio sp. SPO723]
MAEQMQEPYKVFEQLGGDGVLCAPVQGVSIFRMSRVHPETPMMYHVGLTFMISGRKAGVFGGKRFEYGPDHGLLVSTPYPIACEALCSPQEPIRGMHIELDMPQLRALLDELDELSAPSASASREDLGVTTFPMTPEIAASLRRLCEALGDERHSSILGPSLVRELLYWMLYTEAGSTLRAFATRETVSNRLAKAVDYINANYPEKIQVEDLASLAGMSVSSFHRAFKRTVSDAPLQYIKKVRLTKAKSLIVRHGESAGQAGLKVGYDSAAQFSREFKRYFGVSPSQAGELSYSEFE